MNVINLDDIDSDDDIPLIPSCIKRDSATPTDIRPSTSHTHGQTIELSSSDDELLIPSHTRPACAGDESDRTEVYSNSDSSSLPDLDWGCEPAPKSAKISVQKDPPLLSVNKSSVGKKTGIIKRHAASSLSENKTDSLPDVDFNSDFTLLKPFHSTDEASTSSQLPPVPVECSHSSVQGGSIANCGGTAFTSLKNIPAIGSKTTDGLTEKQEQRMRKRLEKEQLALEKKRAAALKTAEREARRAAQPGESHRHMVIEVDSQFQRTGLGVAVEAACLANGVQIRFVSSQVSNVIVFKRKEYRPQTGAVEMKRETDLAVVLQMSDMISLISQDSSETVTLVAYINHVQEKCSGRLTIIVLGCEKYFRLTKTQRNRVFRDNVLGTQDNSTKNKTMTVISRLQYEEALTSLQMTTNTVFIHHETDEDAAKTIMRLNKSIAEAPVKRDKYRQQALSVRGATGLKIGKEGQGARNVWRRMLQESKNISADVSAAIVDKWPSPLLLYQEYKRCGSSSAAELLLQDIEVRRGGGVLQTRRRVGKETSRKIFELLTQSNPAHIIK